MRKKISFILCIAMIICMMPTSSAFAAKKIKAKSVSVAPKAVTIIEGDVVQLTATKNPVKSTDKLTWSSSNTKVATVSSKGLVSGKSAGTATITVKTTSKKKATCTVVVKKYLDESKLRQALKDELKKEFATKQDLETLLSQKLYSKEEIDAKIGAISTDTFATKQEVEALGQSFYTKEEVDGMIGGSSSDWPDGTSLTCLNESFFPRTFTFERELNGNTYPMEITINNISCKKFRKMEFVKDSETGNESFIPYQYEFTVNYKVEGYEAYYQAQIGLDDYYDRQVPYIRLLLPGHQVIELGLDSSKQTVVDTIYLVEDCSEFCMNSADIGAY